MLDRDLGFDLKVETERKSLKPKRNDSLKSLEGHFIPVIVLKSEKLGVPINASDQ